MNYIFKLILHRQLEQIKETCGALAKSTSKNIQNSLAQVFSILMSTIVSLLYNDSYEHSDSPKPWKLNWTHSHTKTMPTLFITLHLLFLLYFKLVPADAKPNPQDDFFQSCPPSVCGSGSNSLSIRFPLRLQSTPAECGLKGLELACSGNETLLSLPSLPPLRVTSINYQQSSLTFLIGSGIGSLSSPCPLQNLTSLDFLSTAIYKPHSIRVSLFSCSYQFVPGPDSGSVAGPVPCLSRPNYFVYVVNEMESLEVIPDGCMMVESGLEIPGPVYHSYLDYDIYYLNNDSAFQEAVENFETRREVSLRWDLGEVSQNCVSCEHLCGYDSELNQSFCQKSSDHGKFQSFLLSYYFLS